MAFVVVATWKAKQGDEGRVENALRRMIPLSRAEEGTLYYQAHISPADPRSFLLYEQYVDERAFDVHRATSHFQEIVVGQIVNLLEDRSVATYESIDV